MNWVRHRSLTWLAPLLVPVVVGATLVLGATTACASASIAVPVRSAPSAHQNLTAAPTSVSIVFSETVKLVGSDIVVYDKNGQQASVGTAIVDKTNLEKMTVSMKGADHQVYVVIWHTVSAIDGQSDAGAFTFGVDVPAGDLVANGSPSSSPWGTILLIVLVGLFALAAGGVGGFLLTRSARFSHRFRSQRASPRVDSASRIST